MQARTEVTPTTATRSALHFARFEFKYILPAAKRQAVENELRYFLQFDPFVEDRPQHLYPVRSLYYDDPLYTAFQDKVDGLHSRSKFRLRTYATSADESAPIFLEIKGRHNNLVFKNRTPVERTGIDWSAQHGDELAQTILRQASEDPTLERFKFELIRKRLKPVALIDYLRRPYVSKYDSTFRLTFDERLEARNTDYIFPDNRKGPSKVLAGYTVLEVKFRHHLPSWFHRIIQSHEMRRVSVSKICKGMEVLGLAFDDG